MSSNSLSREFMAFLRWDSEGDDSVDTILLRYETALPWSIFLAHRSGVRRYLSRDLLYQGLLRPVGNDEDIALEDFLVVSPEGTDYVEVRVHQGGDFLNILINRRELVKFLTETNRMVLRGHEAACMDWVVGVGRCQGAAG